MPRGSKKGEYRGGRAAGTRNKATLLKEAAAELERQQAQGGNIKLMAKEVIEQFMHFFAGYATFFQPPIGGAPAVLFDAKGEITNTRELRAYEDRCNQFERYAKLAVACAKELAPYQSPTFKSIMVTPPPDPNQLARLRDFTLNIFSAGKLIEQMPADDPLPEEPPVKNMSVEAA